MISPSLVVGCINHKANITNQTHLILLLNTLLHRRNTCTLIPPLSVVVPFLGLILVVHQRYRRELYCNHPSKGTIASDLHHRQLRLRFIVTTKNQAPTTHDHQLSAPPLPLTPFASFFCIATPSPCHHHFRYFLFSRVSFSFPNFIFPSLIPILGLSRGLFLGCCAASTRDLEIELPRLVLSRLARVPHCAALTSRISAEKPFLIASLIRCTRAHGFPSLESSRSPIQFSFPLSSSSYPSIASILISNQVLVLD